LRSPAALRTTPSRIGSKRAWEVFLGTHPTGFYADLARAQIEALSNQGNVNLAALPQPPTPSRDTPTRESLEWDRVKDATDPAATVRRPVLDPMPSP
jgi:hypothetical protein